LRERASARVPGYHAEMFRNALVTGGAGFVGSTLALALKQRHPDMQVVALDNLHRRGSELALARLRAGGVRFVHGDIRIAEDVTAAGAFDLLLDCSAEPSVLAGIGGSPAYVTQTNLVGTLNCLEAARQQGACVLFLSTSRVYPLAPLRQIPLVERDARLEIDGARCATPGLSAAGIAEEFPLAGPRSLYGATKLASELFITEYADSHGVPALIDRCGVLTGPWQMGKVDQGIVVHWVASHVFGRPLRYLGYGGTGKQVRDILHVGDLVELVERQLRVLPSARGEIYNVGGGRPCSVSLRELTDLCRHATGKTVEIQPVPENRAADIPIYLSDTARVRQAFDWTPTHTPESIVTEIAEWVVRNARELESVMETG
jgi:CDP-paratose 2-epimerase